MSGDSLVESELRYFFAIEALDSPELIDQLWSVPHQSGKRRQRVLPPLAAAMVVAIAITVTLFARGRHNDEPGVPNSWIRSSANGISIAHPRSWNVADYPFDLPSLGGQRPLLYLSTQSLHNPCTKRANAHGLSIDCTQPVTHLAADGLVITWLSPNFFAIGTKPFGSRSPGIPLTIDGRAGSYLTSPASTQCTGVGGTTTLTVYIPDLTGASLGGKPVPVYFSMIACLGPQHQDSNRADITTMLRSARFTF